MRTEYLLTILLSLISITTYSQSIQNNDFESGCVGENSSACAWNVSWGGSNYCSIEEEKGNNYLLLKSPTQEAVRFVEQSVEISETKEVLVISLSGRVRTREVSGKGASLHLQLYNSQGEYVAKKDMGGSRSSTWIQGNTGWQEYSIQIICPVGVSQVNVGAILQGKGAAHFDDFEMKMKEIKEGEASPIVRTFIGEVVDLMAKHSLYRDSLDLEQVGEKATSIAGDAQTTEECQIGVDYLLACLQQYGDHHSFFMTPKEAEAWKEGGDESNPSVKYPSVKRIGDIGHVYVPGIHSLNSKLILAYADSLQKGLRKVYDNELKGWIVDLRPNDGGNTEPMVMGLGPLLDTGYLGALVDIDGMAERWYYEDGSVFWEEEKGLTLANPVVLPKRLPIAVLTNGATGSSGEIATISFIGNTQTRSFGQTTMGLTTGNHDLELSDGSILFLSSTRMADRNGNVFQNGVVPDQPVVPSKNPENDLVLEAAKAWILSLE